MTAANDRFPAIADIRTTHLGIDAPARSFAGGDADRTHRDVGHVDQSVDQLRNYLDCLEKG